MFTISSNFKRVNTLRPRQNGRHFPDDTFKRIFLNENVRIPIKISMKFVPMSPINNIPALVQIMAWRRPGDKPLSEPMMVSLTTEICVTRPQWVKTSSDGKTLKYKRTMLSLVFHDSRLRLVMILMSMKCILQYHVSTGQMTLPILQYVCYAKHILLISQVDHQK